jgi:hypothetical protein
MKNYSFPPEGDGFRAQCLKVVDAGTLDVLLDLGFGLYKRERVHLFGVAVPELQAEHAKDCSVRDGAVMDFSMAPVCDCGAKQEREAAREATVFVSECLGMVAIRVSQDPIDLNLWPLRIVTTQDKDKYGRYLANVYYLPSAECDCESQIRMMGRHAGDCPALEIHLNQQLLDEGWA